MRTVLVIQSADQVAALDPPASLEDRADDGVNLLRTDGHL